METARKYKQTCLPIIQTSLSSNKNIKFNNCFKPISKLEKIFYVLRHLRKTTPCLTRLSAELGYASSYNLTQNKVFPNL